MLSKRVVVLGSTGLLGQRLAALLRERGHGVVGVAHSTGVDAYSGCGLVEQLRGADTVVDCLNLETMRRAKAVDFFTNTANQVASAARQVGVGRLVCLSIVNAARPEISKVMGYYAGKAAQEHIYRTSGMPVTIGRTTQWFELGETLMQRFKRGSTVIIPRVPIRPVAADAAAAFLVDLVEQENASTADTDVVELAGPQVLDASEFVRRVAAASQPGLRVVGVPMPIKAIRAGGLLPHRSTRTDAMSLDEWLGTRMSGATLTTSVTG